MSEKVVKVTFTIPEEIFRDIQRIAQEEHVSVTHILRRAAKTEQFIKCEEQRGNKILIENAKNKTVDRLVRM